MNIDKKYLFWAGAAAVVAYLFWPKKAYAAPPRLPGPQPLPRLPAPVDDQRPDPLKKDITMPRGIRNHNPMNLRYVESINWQGQTGPDDAGYARFDTVEYGIRAGVKNLLNGYFKRGINTPASIIARYAPSHENPTDNYIDFVASKMGIPKTAPIDPTKANMTKLATIIIEFENGVQPYAETTIARGVKMAMG